MLGLLLFVFLLSFLPFISPPCSCLSHSHTLSLFLSLSLSPSSLLPPSLSPSSLPLSLPPLSLSLSLNLLSCCFCQSVFPPQLLRPDSQQWPIITEHRS